MPKRALDLRHGPPRVSPDPIPFPPPQSYAPATRFSLIPSGLENPGPTVVPVTVYPETAPDPERRRTRTRRDDDEALKTRSAAAANVEVNEVGVGRGISFSRTRFFDCNLSVVGTDRSIIYRRHSLTLATKEPIHLLKLVYTGIG